MDNQNMIHVCARQTEIEAFHAKFFPAPEKPKRKAGATTTGFGPDDAELIAKAVSSPKNGAKIAALNDGSTAGYAGSSEADFAFCSCFAFYTGDDPARLDRLFRASGLMRDKWDEVHYSGGRTYGEVTVQKAIEGCSEFYQPSKRVPVDAEQVKQAAESVKGTPSSSAENTPKNRPPSPPVEGVAVDSIPKPALRTEKGLPEFAAYQIAELLGVAAEAPDSERALAARAVIAFKLNLCHCREYGWGHYNGKSWDFDDRQESRTATLFCSLSHTIRAEAAVLFGYAADLIKANRVEDGEGMLRAAKKHLAHVKQVESERFAHSAMLLSRAALDVPRTAFDPKPWVIGFQNGVWDRTTWRSHQREDYFMHLCPVSVDYDIDQSEWIAVRDRITGGDSDLERTFQETAGYALSGASTFRFLPWSYGPKGSGKSTIGVALQTVLGEMAASLDISLLAADADRGRLGAALVGKRLAIVEEAGNGRIDAEVLKMISGSTMLNVKQLYKESYTAAPRHMVMMIANDPPNMTAHDDALRDRVVALPCNHLLSEGDPLLFSDGVRVEEVRQNPQSMMIRGFVVWALAGLGAVYAAQDVYRAPAVQSATKRFWDDTDTLTEFWEQFEGWETDKRGDYAPKSVLWEAYKAWATERGIRRLLTTKTWVAACRVHGLEESHTSDGKTRVWRSHLKQGKPFSDSSDSLGTNSGKSRGEEKKSYRDFTENNPGTVRTVRKPEESPSEPGSPESDPVAAFVVSECIQSPTATADLAALLRAYQTWARVKSVSPFSFSIPVFGDRLAALAGVSIQRGTGNTTVSGLALRTTESDPPDDTSGFDDPFGDYPNGGVGE